ncbi:hypothetical protein IJ732_06555 [bacterium]|nr:hypothetical protein [bacterium]
MTEINRMNGIQNIQGVQHAQAAKPILGDNGEQAEKKTIENLAGQADIVGRSQIKRADNVKEDVNFMLKNPDIMAKTEAFFNLAYAQLLKEDSPNAYEKAASMATTFAREIAGQ